MGKQKKLVISLPIDCIVDSIEGSSIYILQEINTRVKKDFIIKANILWLKYLFLVIKKVNIIKLNLFISIDRQLQKAKRSDL